MKQVVCRLAPNPLRVAAIIRPQRGFSLSELMVGLGIAMLVTLVILSLMMSTTRTLNTQSGLSHIQERQRLAFAVMNGIVQSAGYYPNPTAQTASSTFTVNSPYTALGQAIYGTAGASTTTPDTLRVRFQTASADGVLDCQGDTNTSGSTLTYDNQFSIASNNLVCAVGNGGSLGSAQILVAGVSNMKLLYGVDTNSSGAPTEYLAAGSVTDWTAVRSVKITLTLVNPMAGQAGQPDTVDATEIIQLMGKS